MAGTRSLAQIACWLCPLLLATILHGQSKNDAEIVAKMTSDLLPLKTTLISSEPLRDESYTPDELQSLVTYGQHKIIQSYQNDVTVVQFRHNRIASEPQGVRVGFRSFFNLDQAYKLTSALAGKDLTEENLKPLVEGIVGMAASAVECRNTSSKLQDSPEFRDSAEKFLVALRTLGVNGGDIRVVTDALFRGAAAAASPPIQVTYR